MPYCSNVQQITPLSLFIQWFIHYEAFITAKSFTYLSDLICDLTSICCGPSVHNLICKLVRRKRQISVQMCRLCCKMSVKESINLSVHALMVGARFHGHSTADSLPGSGSTHRDIQHQVWCWVQQTGHTVTKQRPVWRQGLHKWGDLQQLWQADRELGKERRRKRQAGDQSASTSVRPNQGLCQNLPQGAGGQTWQENHLSPVFPLVTILLCRSWRQSFVTMRLL